MWGASGPGLGGADAGFRSRRRSCAPSWYSHSSWERRGGSGRARMVSGMGAGGAGGRVVGQTTGARGLRHAPRDDAAGRASFITGGGFARRTHLYSHEIAIHGLVLSVHFACYGRVRAGAVGGAREAMTRAEWDKVALTPRDRFRFLSVGGAPGVARDGGTEASDQPARAPPAAHHRGPGARLASPGAAPGGRCGRRRRGDHRRSWVPSSFLGVER